MSTGNFLQLFWLHVLLLKLVRSFKHYATKFIFIGFSANISLNINGSLDVDILLKPSDMMENISGLLVDEKLCRDNEQTTTSCKIFYQQDQSFIFY